MGQHERAHDVVQKLLQRQPNFALSYIDATYPFKQAADREFFLEGLQKAGLKV